MKKLFITDEKGRKVSVIISIAHYKNMQEKIEKLEDIVLYDKVKTQKESFTLLEDYLTRRKRHRHA
ncbi:MAG: hypothetical protein ACHQRM_02690 [Bacteroidia bacterium]